VLFEFQEENILVCLISGEISEENFIWKTTI